MVVDATDRIGGVTESPPQCGRPRSTGEIYSQFESMPPLPALKTLTMLGSDLLRRTAELPDTEQGLLSVLAEYRYAIFTFVAVADRI